MPRHPPCALTHLTTNKMLASTMQHSTHNHTPEPNHCHHNHQHNHQGLHHDRVRTTSPGADQRTTPTGVPSGPNSVPSLPPATPEEATNTSEPRSTSVPPSHTHTPSPNRENMLDTGMESVKGDPTRRRHDPERPHQPPSQAHHQHDGSLERR